MTTHNLTALVTGASEGLGKSFAFDLATRGINLALVALPGTRLTQLANFIRINFNVQVHCFELDLTSSGKHNAIFDHLAAKGIQVDILINNAGLGNWSWFEDRNLDFYKTQIDLNITSTVLLTRLFLDQVNRQQASYLLNVGSLGGHFIVPKKQVYGATKSFVSYFTKCLQLEQRGSNVHISLLSPGGINTKPELLVLNQSLKGISRATILEPEEVAKEAIDGLFRRKKEIIPGALNRFLYFLNRIVPSSIQELIIRRKLKMILHDTK